MKVQQLWSLADARCKFGRYLQVSVGDAMPDVLRVLGDFPARRVEQEQAEPVVHGLRVRLGLRCESPLGAATAELQLGDTSRFYPSDAALAAWTAQAGSGQVAVIYE